MIIKPVYWIFISAAVIVSCSPKGQSDLAFELSPEETLSAILSDASLISPDEVLQLTKNNSSEYRLIDLRPQSGFVKGALEGAINMPVQYLFEPDNLKLITDASYTTILYGNDQLEANGPWVLLRQLGFEHFKVMQGGFEYLRAGGDQNYVAEQARYDYPEIFNQSIEESEAALKAQSPPKRIVPKKIIPQKKKAAEEEEGC